MLRRAAAPDRTVHPAMTAAVLAVLSADGPHGAAAGRAAALVSAGAGVPEDLHARLLTALCRTAGWGGLEEAAQRLLAPVLPAAAERSGALLDAAGRTESWLHVGHRTVAEPDATGLTVGHLPGFGGVPGRAESLFVCALHGEAAAAAPGARRPRLLVAGAAVVRMDELCRGAGPLPRWRLEWRGSTAPTAAGLPERLRTAVRRDPAAAWRLGAAAALVHASPRTVQRELAAAGTTFQAELLAVRLERAAQLVRRTALPLAQVAAAAGFADHAHLANRFRAGLGCAPSEYRRRPEAATLSGLTT
ncbi:helix-turn-helix domain-containing protein [Kitasatospora sp. NPDC059571]|uniref:helix-turn-helix domain-containing protein n=1 Tax=Kitasatospora sp. NPDC059571 TaxID=3346871 RepID=UPI0036A575CB